MTTQQVNGVASAPDAFAKESSSHDIAPDVLIFIAGLSTDTSLNSVKTISQKVERGCRASSTIRARYLLEQRNSETYGNGSKADVARVTRTDVEGRPAIDIYDVQYQAQMLASYDAMTPLARAGAFALALLNSFGRILAILRAALDPRNHVRGALTYGLAVYFAMWLYVVTLILSAVKAIMKQPTVVTAWTQLTGPLGKLRFPMHPPYYGDWTAVGNWFMWLSTTWPGWFVVQTWHLFTDSVLYAANVIWVLSPRIAITLTIVGLLVPGSLLLVSRGATEMVAILNYFNLGTRENRVIGQLGDLIAYVAQRQFDAHGSARIRIVAHSFGCIALVDTLCFSNEAQNDYASSIKSICTIGNPLAIVNAFWGRHFASGSCFQCTAPLLNVWSSDDALSSALATMGVAQKLHVSIEDFDYSRAATYARPTWWDFMKGFLFKAHTMYWDVADQPDSSCFNHIVGVFYKDTAMLTDPVLSTP
jgi:hypothetical protein